MRTEDVVIRELFWNNMIPLLFEKNASVLQIYSNFFYNLIHCKILFSTNIELLEIGRVKKFLAGLQDVLTLYCATRATVNTRQNFWHFFDIFLTSLMTGVILAGKLGGEPATDLLCRFSFSSPFVE